MTQHKWHKEIKAWSDGAEIEIYYEAPHYDWCPVPSIVEWKENQKYRIKPQPKEKKYLYVYLNHNHNVPFIRITKLDNYQLFGKIEVQDD